MIDVKELEELEELVNRGTVQMRRRSRGGSAS